MTGAHPTPPAWRRLGIPPLTRPGRVYVLSDGLTVRVSDDGRDLEPVLPGGHPHPGCAHSTAGNRG